MAPPRPLAPWIRVPLLIFVIVAVPLILVLGGTRLLITDAYLTLEYNKPDFPPDDFGFTLADRLHYGPFALHYMLNGETISYLGDLRFPNGGQFYGEHELAHMVDVKRITQSAFAGFAILLIAFVIVSVVAMRSAAGRILLRNGLFSGGALTVILVIGLGLGVLLSWDTFFTQFHEVFFADGTWTFAYSDSLIRLYPMRFWQDAAFTIGGLTIGGAVLIMAGCWLWARRVK